MKIYALRIIKTGNYLSIVSSSCEDEDTSIDTIISLDTGKTSCYWTTTDLQLANYVRCISAEWFSSDLETPCHSYTEEVLEIVELGSEEVIPCEDLPYDFEVFTKLKRYQYPWSIEKSKTTRSYSYQEYQKYLKLLGK